MQEAALLYAKEKYNSIPVDDAFIKKLASDQRKRRNKRIINIAAAIMLIAATSVSSVIWVNDDGVYGGRRVIDRCVSLMSDLNIEEEIDEDGLVTQVITIDTEKDIPKLKEYIGDVHGPGYVPEGYSFNTLTVRKYSDSMILEYLYKNQNDDNEILCFVSYNDGTAETVVRGDPYISEKTGQKMYVDELPETGEFIVTEAANEYTCTAAGTGSSSEGIRMIGSLHRY